MDERQRIEGEINSLRMLIADTNDDIMNAFDDVFGADSALELTQRLFEAAQDLKEIVTKRIGWRRQIAELKEQLEQLPVEAHPADDESAQ